MTKTKAIIGILIQIPWICALFQPPAAAPAGRHLWVLQEPNEIVEYDPITFATRRRVQVPRQAVEEPQSLFVNHTGQMLFVLSLDEDDTDEARRSAANRIWLWNGQAATNLDRGIVSRRSRTDANFSIEETIPRCFLSADGQHLYWFANEIRKLREEEIGPDISAMTTFRAWQTDLKGSQAVQLAVFSFGPCKCETGVRSETCPEAEFWIPDNGIDNFFLITHWIPGQLGATYQASFLYRKSGANWPAARLPQVLEEILDTAEGGEILLHAQLDKGCCGWDNEGNDQVLMIRYRRSTVLFDERKRYANPNYDASFFPSNALLAPDLESVAMTIIASAKPSDEIRLSSDGKADPQELQRIRLALSDLPAVEILRLGDPPRQISMIPHATLAGWLNEKEIVIVQDRTVVIYDVAAGVRRQSQIKIPKESCVFVR